jgi:hypothetical protein
MSCQQHTDIPTKYLKIKKQHGIPKLVKQLGWLFCMGAKFTHLVLKLSQMCNIVQHKSVKHMHN